MQFAKCAQYHLKVVSVHNSNASRLPAGLAGNLKEVLLCFVTNKSPNEFVETAFYGFGVSL